MPHTAFPTVVVPARVPAGCVVATTVTGTSNCSRPLLTVNVPVPTGPAEVSTPVDETEIMEEGEAVKPIGWSGNTVPTSSRTAAVTCNWRLCPSTMFDGVTFRVVATWVTAIVVCAETSPETAKIVTWPAGPTDVTKPVDETAATLS